MNVFEILTNWLLDQLATRWLVIEKKTQEVFHRNNRNDCGIPDHTHLTFDLKDIIMITKNIHQAQSSPTDEPNSNNKKKVTGGWSS